MADFGIVEAAAIVGAIGAGTGAAVTYTQAQERNRAARRTKQAAIAAADTQKNQLNDQASLERAKRLRELELTRARIRVAGAASGFDANSEDFQALDRQAVLDTGVNFDIIDQNLKNNKARVDSGLNADLVGLRGQQQNLLLQSLVSSLAGAQTGLSLYGSINSINGPSQKPTTEASYFTPESGFTQ